MGRGIDTSWPGCSTSRRCWTRSGRRCNRHPAAGRRHDTEAIARYTAVLGKLATSYSVDKNGRASPLAVPGDEARRGRGPRLDGRRLREVGFSRCGGSLCGPRRSRPPGVRRSTGTASRFRTGSAGSCRPTTASSSPGSRPLGEHVVVAGADHPRRGLTLILLANSDGLEKAFAPNSGDVTVSPFAEEGVPGAVRPLGVA